jgi:hypothetical protein
MRHKHADMIHAYAEGAEIQFWSETSKVWEDIANPSFNELAKYRIKPQPKPDFEYKVSIFMSPNGPKYAPYISQFNQEEVPNLKVVFDGETGELKSAEVLK